MKKRTAIAASLFGLSVVVSGCGAAAQNTNTPTSNATPVKGGTITVAIPEEPDTLDPQKTGAAVADNVLGQIGGSLVFQNPKTLEFEPALAKKWTVSNDGLTWTFDLRTDVTFQDGTPFTAEDMVKSYQRALDPKTASKVAGSDLADVASVSAPDSHTFVIKLKKPFAPLLADLSDAGFMQPIDFKALQSEGDTAYGRHPVSVGPWKFDSWQNGQSITLDRYDGYHWAPSFFQNQSAVYPDKLVYKVVSQEQTRLAALKTGEVDIAPIDAKDVSQFQNNPQYQIISKPRNGLGLFVMFNLQKPALQDLKVRQAINEAINKQAIIKAVVFGQADPSYGPLPKGFPDYDPAVEKEGYQFNVDSAKKLLTDAGYTQGSDGFFQKDGKPLTLTLLTMQNGTWDQAAQLIQAELKDIGINVKIETLEWGTLLQTATKGDFDMTLMGYHYNDPDVLYLFLHSSQSAHGLNFDHVQDPKLDALLEKGRGTTDPAQRKEVYAELQKYVIDNALWAPIYTEREFYVVNRRVHNVQVHPLGNLLLQDAWVEQK